MQSKHFEVQSWSLVIKHARSELTAQLWNYNYWSEAWWYLAVIHVCISIADVDFTCKFAQLEFKTDGSLVCSFACAFCSARSHFEAEKRSLPRLHCSCLECRRFCRARPNPFRRHFSELSETVRNFYVTDEQLLLLSCKLCCLICFFVSAISAQ